jgi:hypothetical protein
VFLVLAAPSVTSTINAAVSAHGELRTFRAHVVLSAVVNGDKKRTTYEIASDGKNAVIRIQKPERGEEAASDRTFYFGSLKLTGYDAVANEQLSRALPKNKSLLDRYTFVLGAPDDMVKNILDPSAMQAFLLSMRKLTGWRLRTTPDGAVATRAAGGSTTDLRFYPKTGLVHRVDVTTGKNEIHWSFEYARGGPTALRPPASARLVSAFTVSLVPPKYTTPRARRIAEDVVAAYRGLKNGEIIVDGDDGHATIYLTGRKLREDQPHLTYAYDGSRLSILGGKANAFYAGPSVRRAVPDYVAEIGGRVDPISRQILQRKVPFQEVFAPRVAVSYSGEMTMGGGSFDLLKLEFPRGRVSLFVRRSDHLLDGAVTESLDDQGHLLARSARRFHYAMIGRPQPDYRFIVTRRAGQAKLPLPPLKLGH